MSSGLFLNLDAGATLITDLPKQAAQFRLAYAKWKRDQGIHAWSSPAIVSWSEWLKSMGEDLLWSGYSGKEGVRSLLTPLQEQTVWEQVIRAEIDQPLLHLSSTAALARQAWGLMQAWRMPDPSATLYPSDDVRSYTKWVGNYYKRCKNAAWLDQARLPDTLKRAINNNNLQLPRQMIFAGFIQFTPQQFELITAIKNQDTNVSLYKADKLESEIKGYRFASSQDELYAIARWARKLLEQDPECHIGIAVPDLESKRAEFDYILRKTLYPNSFADSNEFLNAAYQFSVGEHLAHSEVASMAMSLLELMKESFSIEVVSQILRSPYCYGGRAENNERIKIDAWLRNQGLKEFDLTTLLDLLATYRKKQNRGNETTLFEVSLMTLKTSAGIFKNYYSPSIWSKHFLSYLEKFGWPDVSLSVTEQRHAQVMRQCLTEFATVDFVQNEMDFRSAITTLKRIFYAKRLSLAQVFAPVQILDIKEVHGLNFEYLWVAQLSDKVLPENSYSNPMIPYAWQRKRKISGSTPEIRLQEAQQRIKHFKQAAKHCVFSFAFEGQNSQLHVPALLRDIDFDKLEKITTISEARLSVEWIKETHGPVYKSDSTVGTSVFKHQAACAFKGFAKKRLAPDTIEYASHGLSAIERGKLLHSALEFVWLRIGTLETLNIAVQSEHLEMQIWEIVDKVIAVYEKRLSYKLSSNLRTLELTRLVRLTMAWLAVEKERAPFELHQSEHEAEVEINGLNVQCRIDRIDEINDVGFAIIDYKSGMQTSSSWFGERPDEPQLPIYALAEENKVVAIVYANLKPGNFSFNGVSEFNEIFPGIKAFDELGKNQRRELGWHDLLPYWRDNLDKIAEEFQLGLALPNPKKGKQTCRYCELEALCRVNSSGNDQLLIQEDEHV